MAGGERIRKSRLDALSDGVFAFAMTLLVLNLELPDDFHPRTSADLARAFGAHLDDLLVYVISFFVLARRWFGQSRLKPEPEIASDRLARWTLLHLFFITMVPFSTQIVGRYDLAPAIWLYAANVGLAALVAIRLTRLTEEEAGEPEKNDGTFELGVFVGTAILSSIVALFDTTGAMLVYLLNALTPLLKRVLRR